MEQSAIDRPRGPIHEFDVFRIDTGERLLLRDGRPVPLTPKAFDLLAYFVEHPQRLLDKATLLEDVWPDAAVEEANLAFQVSALRKALDEGRRGDSLIQTVPRKGYRFVAPVTLVERTGPVTAPAGNEPPVPTARGWPGRPRAVEALAVILVLVAAAALLRMFTPGAPGPAAVAREAITTRLTANPTEVPLDSARISGDGKMVAYAEPGGIRVQVIETGDTHLLPSTAGMHPLGWSRDSNAVRAYACNDLTCDGWEVPLVGERPRRTGLRFPIEEIAVPSPDGERWLRIVGFSPTASIDKRLDGRLWRVASVDSMDGSEPRVVLKVQVSAFCTWSADSKRILYVAESDDTLISAPVDGGASLPVFKADHGQHIAEVLELADHRLVLAISRSAPTGVRSAIEYSIQEAETDSAGVARGSPRVLVPWRKEAMFDLSASAAGTRLVFRSGMRMAHVYVAAFNEADGRADVPKCLTIGDWDEVATAWSADGSRLLLESSRYDDRDILAQGVDGGEIESVVVRPGKQYRPEVTSDGRWVLYAEAAEGPRGPRAHVLRRPLAGGRSEVIAEGSVYAFPRCSSRGRCILEDLREGELVVRALDPERGAGDELGHWTEGFDGFCLLPDGNEVAFIGRGRTGRNDTIRIVSLTDHSTRDVVVGGVAHLSGLDPTADGKGFFSTIPGETGRTLVLVRLDGAPKALWSHPGLDPGFAIASRDGRRFAITAATWHSDVWMASGF